MMASKRSNKKNKVIQVIFKKRISIRRQISKVNKIFEIYGDSGIFLANERNSEIKWQDMVKGVISYQGNNLSDPIIIRADGTMTYMLCSTIDDIDYEISHIIRGEDHVSNTAIQIQMFEASATFPNLDRS